MVKLWKWKDEALIIMGTGVLLFGLMFLAVAIILLFSNYGPERESGVCALIFTIVIFMCPSALLFRKGLRLRKRQKEMEDLAEYLRTMGTVSMSHLSRALGRNEVDAVMLLREAMEKGLVQGYFSEEGEESQFVVMDYPGLMERI